MTSILLLAAFAVHAQADGTAPLFQEASPPPGVVTGHIVAGGRAGVLIAGGKTVYSNDTFAVTFCGRKVTWKVLSVTGSDARFARETPVDAETVWQERPPNFAGLVGLLERYAASYSAASTSVIKDQAIAEARAAGAEWCRSNSELRVKGRLAEIKMLGDNRALIRLKDVDTGALRGKKPSPLYVHALFEAIVPFSRDLALAVKAGDGVLLRGRPAFKSGFAAPSLLNGNAFQGSFTSFSNLADASIIGSLFLEDAECVIFDPKQETVKQNFR